MRVNLAEEIAELRQVYGGLTRLREMENAVVVFGPLPFEASAEGLETIEDTFEIDLIVPDAYPEALPWVRETSGRIRDDYGHVEPDGKLCLAVPIEERLVFRRDPCLCGFVTGLLIPYCYGYCFWERHGVHPFGEREHGHAGIVRFYMDKFHLDDEIQALEVVFHLFQHGYRGHHNCPCGSGAKLRTCHGPVLLELSQNHTAETARFDLEAILAHCVNMGDRGELDFPRQLGQRILSRLQGSRDRPRR